MKIIGNIIAVLLICSGVANAQEYRNAPVPAEEASHYAWADVLRVNPVYDDGPVDPNQAPQQRQECYDEQVPTSPPPKDNRVGGTIIGALIGGVLGNTIGKGDGRKAATAVGVVAGAAVGNNVSGQSSGDPGYSTQHRCRMVDVSPSQQRRIASYDVEYRYRGEVYMARVPYDPGDRMRVRVSVVPAD
jgi:uncharacterized protein YcfJ